MPRPALLLAVLLSAPAEGARGYSVFTHPKGEYTVEYPKDWRTIVGDETLSLRPPGRKGNQVRVLLEYRPAAESTADLVKDYVADLSDDPLTKVVERLTQRVAGRMAERLSRVASDAAGRREPADGPMREEIVVVPGRRGALVVRLAGVGDEYAKTLPEFERIVARLKLAPEKK